ncbi:aluminum-activated malate transporter 2-like isoform X2 [Coffea arabica]|uniref:Aluminum-activated malate transporter 2-like isoform X2 n=1 Tax=Coffea arabica TaxID=13443 RepID=A0ABM4WHP8_COFAR
MEMASENQESVGFLSRGCCWFTSFMRNLASKLVLEPARTARSLAREDPRRIIHSIKVGLAIALVSLIYYFDPLYEGFGVSAMWAVMTVVVVFEFSVGATLGRCVNRGIGTFIGGALGVAAHRLASCFGSEIVEPIILAVSIFIFAASGTFARFFPKWKARCDYGLLIFILTFCLISVSGYRDDEVIDIALTRLSTVMIGGSAALAICILLFPVWAGEDLHHLVADNIEKLGDFLEGFGDEYFKTLEDGNVNFAKWEFRHGKFRFRHPWGEYQKIGGLIRECAFRLDSLNGYLKSEVQTPQEIREIFQESCQTMSSESSHALKNMARAIRTMTSSYVAVAKSHIAIAKSAADNLKSLLKTNSWQQTDLLQIIPVITVASLLIEVVSSTVKIADSVHQLASLARFKKISEDDASKSDQRNTERILRSPSIEGSHGLTISVE